MKKIIVGIAVLGVGAVGYWLLSPLWRTEVVDETLPGAVTLPLPPATDEGAPESTSTAPAVPETSRELYAGSFTGFDKLHQGSGTAKVIQADGKTYLRFESDFTVSNGPDLYVGFGKGGQYVAGSEVGALKGNVGAQNYELSQGFDAARFDEVYVWCRAFSVPFAKAKLQKL